MGIFFRFISLQYLKAFFIVFIGLIGFYVIIDLLLNYKLLPKSANIILLYIFFLSCSAISQVLVISLIFSLILFLVNLIRSNELVSLYGLGFSKNKLIFYPFLWALIISLFYIALNFTSFAYFKEYTSNIRNHGSIIQENKSVFLKYNSSFIYIDQIKPFSKSLDEIKIFEFKNYLLKNIISAKNAYFKDNNWVLKEAKKISFPVKLKLNESSVSINKGLDIAALKGFKPQVIENISQNSSYSILDAYRSIKLFRSQELNIRHLKVDFYTLLFTPLFAPFFMLIIYYYFPTVSRFFNLALISFIYFVITLCSYGLIILFIRLSKNAVFSPEAGIIAPIFLTIFLGIFSFYKNKN